MKEIHINSLSIDCDSFKKSIYFVYHFSDKWRLESIAKSLDDTKYRLEDREIFSNYMVFKSYYKGKYIKVSTGMSTLRNLLDNLNRIINKPKGEN